MAKNCRVITVTPDLAADSVAATVPYADKDVIGNLLTLSNAVLNTKGVGKLDSLVVRSKIATALIMDIFFLNEAPAAAFGDNNSAYALSDDDLSKVIGVVHVAAAEWNDSNTLNYVAQKSNLEMNLQALAGQKDLYMIVIARGAITFVAAGDMEIDVAFEQD